MTPGRGYTSATQRSFSQKYCHGHCILTGTTLEGMKDAGSFSLILAITTSVSQWRQTPKKCSVYDKKKNISNICSKQFCCGEIQSSSCPLQGKLPSPCPQLRGVQLQQRYKLTAADQHWHGLFPFPSSPVHEGDFWLPEQVSRYQ